MRAFLIFLVAMGASVYGFLVALHGLLPSASPEYGVTVSVDQPARHQGSWGTYLPIPSISQQSLASNPANERPSEEVTQAQLSMRADTPSKTLDELIQASELVSSPETSGQGSVSSTPLYNMAVDTTESSPPKAVPSKRKARSRAAKSVPSDNAVLTAYGPQNGRPTARPQRRGLGFFLFGRFAARD